MLIETVTGTRYESWPDAELLAPPGVTPSTFAFVTQTGPDVDPTLAMGHFDPKSDERRRAHPRAVCYALGLA
jgi:hypothetical protein